MSDTIEDISESNGVQGGVAAAGGIFAEAMATTAGSCPAGTCHAV